MRDSALDISRERVPMFRFVTYSAHTSKADGKGLSLHEKAEDMATLLYRFPSDWFDCYLARNALERVYRRLQEDTPSLAH
jgi:hypothetical protein